MRMAKAMVLSVALLAASAQAGPANPSQGSSEASTLAVAISVAAPVMVFSAGVQLTVVAVESTAQGTVWVLERASDGARASVRFAGKALEGAGLVIGATVEVSAFASGYVLSAAGRALAFVPNELGASLLYNEQIAK